MAGVKRDREADDTVRAGPGGEQDEADTIPIKRQRTDSPRASSTEAAVGAVAAVTATATSDFVIDRNPLVAVYADDPVDDKKKDTKSNSSDGGGGGDGGGFIRIRGMPYQATKRDVMDFFRGDISFSSEFLSLMETLNVVTSSSSSGNVRDHLSAGLRSFLVSSMLRFWGWCNGGWEEFDKQHLSFDKKLTLSVFLICY
eukprot:TRINITY_DN6766_c0_g1_i1.p1 TRINITY_DN6766_c0_g1~~TRINITY_DN6766_c0_g1_i1.p1  ORF type:complete len:217 (+),score=40.66 TRINITY_DN6766_c0_g1_i1:55-651(+)